MTEEPTIAAVEAQLAQLQTQLAQLKGEPQPHQTPDEQRATVLRAFSTVTKLPALERVIQRGRDPDTARFTLQFADGTEVRVGTIKILWSRAELSKALAVAIQRVVAPMKPADWNDAIASIFKHAVDVEETPDETFEETVHDWLVTYARRASTDANGAAAQREPFRRDGQLLISASSFAKYVRRDSDEKIQLHEIRQALADLGFTTTHVNYTIRNGAGTVRSSASYYTAPLTVLRETAEDAA